MPDLVDYLCFTAENETVTIGSVSNWYPGNLQSLPTIQHSLDKSTWNSWTWGSSTITLSPGQSVYWRGNNDYISGANVTTGVDLYTSTVRFTIDKPTMVTGNLMTLLDATGQLVSISNVGTGFAELFFYTKITTPPRLPATTLCPSCYRALFYGCDLLGVAPDLPSNSIPDRAYFQMFAGCTSLLSVSNASVLRGTISDTYQFCGMFENCTALQDLGGVVFDTIGVKGAQYLCRNCTSLVIPPRFTTTTATEHMLLGAFSGCTSLTTMPDFRTITGSYFSGSESSFQMETFKETFLGCTNLRMADCLATVGATTTTQGKYLYDFHTNEFKNCTSLSHITIPFDNWDAGALGINNLTGTGEVVVLSPDLDVTQNLPPYFDIRSPGTDIYNLARSFPGISTVGGVFSIQDQAIGVGPYGTSALSNTVQWGAAYPIYVKITNGTHAGATKLRPHVSDAPASRASVYLLARTGYCLPEHVNVSGAVLLHYDSATGEVEVGDAIGPVLISADCLVASSSY